MQYHKLGKTNIDVSVICLGTMTWGEQNTESDAHQQLDYAVEHGINFIDAAELYPVPPKAQTQGLTEEYLGSWLANRNDRDALIIASKAAGPGEDWVGHIRGGPRLNKAHLNTAIDTSLRRLQTDYIDLYQLHWPERNTNYFGSLGYSHEENQHLIPIEETLEALAGAVDAGKIRHIGISNETPWGTMKFLQAAEKLGLPRIVSIQNPYSLLNRSFEVGLAEIAHREQTGLLAYSPLAFGVLSGKYLYGALPPNSRLARFPDYARYSNDAGIAATLEYIKLAKRFGIGPAHMALAFVNTRSFLTSTIIGATTLEQLQTNIASIDIELSPELLDEIESIHRSHSNPCP